MQKRFSFSLSFPVKQGCQMAYFQTKNPNLGTFWKVLQCLDWWYIFGNLVYFTAIWYILWPFGLICGHLIYFVAIWYTIVTLWHIYPFWYVVSRKIWQPCCESSTWHENLNRLFCPEETSLMGLI
jgi:hypothetical protein